MNRAPRQSRADCSSTAGGYVGMKFSSIAHYLLRSHRRWSFERLTKRHWPGSGAQADHPTLPRQVILWDESHDPAGNRPFSAYPVRSAVKWW